MPGLFYPRTTAVPRVDWPVVQSLFRENAEESPRPTCAGSGFGAPSVPTVEACGGPRSERHRGGHDAIGGMEQGSRRGRTVLLARGRCS